MKDKINILIVDDNESFIEEVKESLSSHAVIEVVKAISDSRKGLDYIINNSKDFDTLLLDIIMPDIDGITILEEMKKHNINKNVIILSSYRKENTLKLIKDYKVDYFMPKPIDINVLSQRIMGISSLNSPKILKEDNKVEVVISKMLHDLGIPSHIRGYEYIREGVYLMYKSPGKAIGVTKTLYPAIADRYSTTASRVERAIRHAIEVSWSRGDYDLMDDIFGHSVDFDRSKPTNSEFIATLADNIRLKNNLIAS